MEDDETADADHSQTDGNKHSSGNSSDAPRADSPPAAGSAQSGSGEQPSAGENAVGRTDESRSNGTDTADQGQRLQAGGNNDNSSGPSVKIESDDDLSPLFEPESDSESQPDLENDSEEPLFASPSHGLGNDVRTVAWNSQSGAYINRYGKKGCSRYRLDDNCTAGYTKEDSEDFFKNSLGAQQQGRKSLYTKDQFTGEIWGVAWESDGSKNDLHLIDPKLAGQGNKVWPRTYVLVLWEVNKEKLKRWETRSTLRRLWNKKKADKAIFEAACKAEELYIATTNKGMRGYTRSPAAALRRDTKSLSPSRSHSRSRSRGRNLSPTPARTSRRSASNDMADLEEALKEFRMNYCEMSGVETFADLSSDDKQECINMWKKEKSNLGLAV